LFFVFDFFLFLFHISVMNYIKKFYILFFVTTLFAQEAAINLINDSPFSLRVSVQSADGTYLGGDKIAPGEFKRWTTTFKPTDLDVPDTPNASLTPFTVIWRCEQGDFYSMCDGVSPGSLVRASICPGAHYCKPKEKEVKCPECKCECICPKE
jgi:hypothetical protein